MKINIKKSFVKTLICLILAGMFLMPDSAFAASDPAIMNMYILPESPAPGEEVDFILSYDNRGSSVSGDVELIIDYNENIFENISLGDTDYCQNTEFVVRCFFTELAPVLTKVVGFKANVMQDVKDGTQIITMARIEEEKNIDNDITNDYAKVITTISGITTTHAVSAGLPAGMISSESSKLEEPSKNQGVALFDVSETEGWETSGLITDGLKFMIRGKEALAWALGIKDSGFHNSAIKDSYLKVLTIVNSLFIVGLLIIAGMWIFSILIPRRYLKKVILIYGMAVVFVNFAMPLNQLFIDATGLLQKSLIGNVSITSIVEIPDYNDSRAIGYQNETNFLKQSAAKKLTLNISEPETDTATGSTDGSTTGSTIGTTTGDSIVVGTIHQDFLQPSYMGSVTNEEKTETVQLFSTSNDQEVKLNSKQSLELNDETKFNPDKEHSIFAFLMMLFTGSAYFGMALILILRIVILWALLIVSPVLFLLAIFNSTRSYFINWAGLYARWLLIGPLLALGIGMVVGIWQTVGLPITSAYTGLGQFGVLSNIGFYLPGKDTVNTLSTTPEMMEYILFLVMLYLPILFAFMLTRQKIWSKAAAAVTERYNTARESERVTAPTTGAYTNEEKGKGVTGEFKTLTTGFKGFLDTQLAKLTKTAVPVGMKEGKREDELLRLGTATSFLPEHLALSGIHNLFGLISGETMGSRNTRRKAIEKLASAETIKDRTEREHVMAVREEIQRRADKGSADAMLVMNEINSVVNPVVTPVVEPIVIPIDVKTKKEKKLAENPLRMADKAKEASNSVKGAQNIKPSDDDEQAIDGPLKNDDDKPAISSAEKPENLKT